MKSTRSLVTSFLLASSLALGLSLPAQARPGMDGPEPWATGMSMHGEHGMPGPGGMPRFLRGLDLTEQQRDKIFEMMHAQAPALREKAKELRKAHAELRGLAFSERYDEDKAKALIERGAKVMSELALMRARTGHSIYQLLTAEQRRKLEENKARWEERRMGPQRG